MFRNLILTFIPLLLQAQTISYTFEKDSLDGWTQYPANRWETDTHSIHGNYSLHHAFDNSDAGEDVICISHDPLKLSNGITTWRFSVQYPNNPSGSNYWAVFLTSDAGAEEMYKGGNANGYVFGVNFTGTSDALEFYKQVNTSASSIYETDFTWDADYQAGKTLCLQITRQSDGTFEFFADTSGEGNYYSLGTYEDNTFASSTYFGILAVYTATKDQLLWIDDVEIQGDFSVDSVQPSIQKVEPANETTLDITFDEACTTKSDSYILLNGNDTSISISALSDTVFRCIFDTTLQSINTIEVFNISDLSNNKSDTSKIQFKYSIAEENDLLITEIMYDPSPAVSLPEVEFVEIVNNTSDTFNLNNYSIFINDKYKNLPQIKIYPGEYLIICERNDTALFEETGGIIPITSMPALVNSGATLQIKNFNNKTVASASYQSSDFADDTKEDGGWSIELINFQELCKGHLNWAYSTDSKGGTPEQQNSVYSDEPDIIAPALIQAFFINDSALKICFDEAVADSITADSNYFISGNNSNNLASIHKQSGGFCYILAYKSHFAWENTYSFTISSLSDCLGNQMNDTTIEVYLEGKDTLSPLVEDIIALNEQKIQITFNEVIQLTDSSIITIDSLSVEDIEFYSDSVLWIELSGNLQENNTVDIRKIADTSGNILAYYTEEINYPIAAFHDIIIIEFLPDPEPSVGLPEVEFIEIYNASGSIFNLSNYKLILNESEDVLPAISIAPEEYVILCPRTDTSEFKEYGKVIGVPGMNAITNTEAPIALRNFKGELLHFIDYSIDWYTSEKSEGGWSLEMVDLDYPCAGQSNWKESVDAGGGTPGEVNSVLATNPDTIPPEATNFFPEFDMLQIEFSKTMDSLSVATIANYSFPGEIVDLLKATVSTPDFKTVELQFQSVLQEGVDYSVELSRDITDCSGNTMDSAIILAFALPGSIDSGDIIINEILYEPGKDNSEFIEFYNHSDKWLNIKSIRIGEYDEYSISVYDEKQISYSNKLFPPKSYLLISDDKDMTMSFYPGLEKYNIIEPTSWFSLSNDGKQFAIIDNSDRIIDVAVFNPDMHYSLLSNTPDVSLERIDILKPGLRLDNWHSASSTVGYATPLGYNSQAYTGNNQSDNFSLKNKKFTPNNDGFEDYLIINYKFTEPGWTASIRIFNIDGNLVKELLNNSLLSVEGDLVWNGRDDAGILLKNGYYIVFIEAFHIDGRKEFLKEACVVLP